MPVLVALSLMAIFAVSFVTSLWFERRPRGTVARARRIQAGALGLAAAALASAPTVLWLGWQGVGYCLAAAVFAAIAALWWAAWRSNGEPLASTSMQRKRSTAWLLFQFFYVLTFGVRDDPAIYLPLLGVALLCLFWWVELTIAARKQRRKSLSE